MSREDIPISCRGGFSAWTKTDILLFTYKLKKIMKNHEINENKILKGQNCKKNKLYTMAIFNCFKNEKNDLLTFLPKIK